MNQEIQKPKLKRLKPGSVPLLVAGELLLPKAPDMDIRLLFKRYESLLESLANMERQERIINYKFLIGLILTSHAKKTPEISERKALFDLKNSLFKNLANNRSLWCKLTFKYLVSKNFRVLSFCEKCEKDNKAQNSPKHRWKFCPSCDIDRKFFNVLSMHHKFKSGSVTLFLSNDRIKDLEYLKTPPKDKLENFKEEARFKKHRYNVKNLDIFNLDSVRQAHAKLLSF